MLRRALDLNREIGYRYGEAVALGNLGAALLGLDRAEDGIDSLQQARDTFAEIGYPDGEGYAIHISGSATYPWDTTLDALECLR